MPRKEGQWHRREYTQGPDSALFGTYHNNNNRYLEINELKLGAVSYVQPEPVFKQHSVSVDLVTNGILTSVAWPGAQVNANTSGSTPGGVALGIHGLWEAPLPGQQVLVGFVDGSAGNPIVINKYPYNALIRPDLEAMHILPLTTKAHGPTDVVLGHHTGSYIAIRGTVPLPAEIDIFAYTVVTITALTFMTVTVTSALTVSAGSYSLTSAAAITISATAGMTLTASTITIPPATTSVTIGTGTEAVLKGTSTLVEHTKLQLLLTALLAIIQGPPIPEPGLGSPSAFQLALAAATAATPAPSYPATLLSTRLLID